LAGYFNEPELQVADSAAQLKELVLSAKSNKNTVLLWMSSGRFDGLDLMAVVAKLV
jgi:hypothetical protein